MPYRHPNKTAVNPTPRPREAGKKQPPQPAVSDSGDASAWAPRASGSKTLHRGLLVLETLAGTSTGLGISDMSAATGLHRTILHRLLETLMQHRLVARDDTKRYHLALGIVELAGSVANELQVTALPEMSALAEEAGATTTLTIADGGECVALLAVEPRSVHIHVSYRAGFRYPLSQGASGIAILASRSPEPGERREVGIARRRGYATSHGEVRPGVFGIAAPICLPGMPAEASLGVQALSQLDERSIAPRLIAAAQGIAAKLH